MSDSGLAGRKVQWFSAILWPSFLVAGAATGLFFSLFDPRDLFLYTTMSGLDRLGAYSAGFFAFWLMTALSSALTTYFMRPPESFNPGKPGAKPT